jgi:hypothetical protein
MDFGNTVRTIECRAENELELGMVIWVRVLDIYRVLDPMGMGMRMIFYP